MRSGTRTSQRGGAWRPKRSGFNDLVTYRTEDTRLFNAAIQDCFSERGPLHDDGVTILATGVGDDGSSRIVYRVRGRAVMLGLHVDLERFATLFDPNDPAYLGRVLASDELADPADAGDLTNEDWGRGLVPDPACIRWRSF